MICCDGVRKISRMTVTVRRLPSRRNRSGRPMSVVVDDIGVAVRLGISRAKMVRTNWRILISGAVEF